VIRSILVTILVSAVVFTGIGFVAGYNFPYPEEEGGGEAADAAPAIAADPCDQTAEAVARRNTFWTLWSGKDVEPFTPDAALAAAIGVIIKPDSPADARNGAIQLYLSKSALYFSPEQMTQAQEDLANGPEDKRLAMFRYIAALDLDAARLVGCVLADTDRVNAFLAGQPVPPETAP